MSSLISTGWQAGFLSILPAIETHAAIRFRRLPASRREDAVQETIATACLNYELLVARGQLDVAHAGTLADFAVRHVRAGRRIGGKQDGAKDVMSLVCQRRHGVKIVDCHGKPSDVGIGGWLQIAVEDRKMPIPDLAAFRIDFAAWLRTLSRRDRNIIGAMIRGERTFAVAERFGVTAGRVSQLRRRYEREWHLFQGDAA
jgi:hypothetical protein